MKPESKQACNRRTAWSLAALSGILLALTLPGYYGLWYLGWFALVPLLVAVPLYPRCHPRLLTLVFALFFSFMVSPWYLHLFGTATGLVMLIGDGVWYSFLLWLGWKLQEPLLPSLRVWVLPIVWTALEFIKFTLPYVDNWWFLLLAKSQWSFAPVPAILNLTGYMGLSFLLILSNAALAQTFLVALHRRTADRAALAALGVVLIVLIWGIGYATESKNLSTIAIPDETQQQGTTLWHDLERFARQEEIYLAVTDTRKTPDDTLRLINPAGHTAGDGRNRYLFETEGRAYLSPDILSHTDRNDTMMPGLCHRYRFIDRAGDTPAATTEDRHEKTAFAFDHETQIVFRAVDHRMLFATIRPETVTVKSDPYSCLVIYRNDPKNTALYVLHEKRPYSRLGNGFGWLMVVLFILLCYNFLANKNYPQRNPHDRNQQSP